MNKTEEMEKEKFLNLMGKLEKDEIEVILQDLKKYNADQIFIDCCELELESRN